MCDDIEFYLGEDRIEAVYERPKPAENPREEVYDILGEVSPVYRTDSSLDDLS